MSQLKELREKQATLVVEARERLNLIDDKTDETRAAELEAAHDAAMVEYDKLEARAAKLEKLEAAERDLNERSDDKRPGEGRKQQKSQSDETPEQAYHRVFRSFMMGGTEMLSAEERAILRAGKATEFEERAQGTTPSSAGGYLIPQGFMAELVKSMKAYGPMLDPGVTREITTSAGNLLPWPTMDDTANVGRRIAENVQVTTASLLFGQKTLSAWKYTSDAILVSSELEQDSALPVEGIVRDAMAERIGRIVNTELTTGTGASQPNGIMTAAAAGVTAASATAIVFDDLIGLFHSVDPAYRSAPSVRWMFNDATLKALRKLKDGEGDYIWQDGTLAGGVPSTILNKPYEINQAVADIATGAKTVAFGAMDKYVVRRVREFALKRLVERYADYDQVGFIGFARYDGNLMDTAAVKVLTQA